MKTLLYPRLALLGIKKNFKLYLPYLFACIGMMTVFYITAYLANSEFVANQPGGAGMSIILQLGWIILTVFSSILLFYTNSFLIKRRKTEFGLYNILGMGKNNISIILVFENFFILLITLIVGISVGVLFSKLMEILLINMLGGENSLDFYVDWTVVVQEIGIYSMLFAMILLKGTHQVSKTNAVSLFQSTNSGEKPPRANWFLAISGAILLIAGYVLANIVKNPIFAILAFFVAVILVIAATYLLFISGSVVVCKLLKKNKKYYYKTNHFVSTSQMAFRMKRNGAGLASICILATMALVTISSTSGLYFGGEEIMRRMYPRDFYYIVNTENQELVDNTINAIYETAREKGVEPSNVVQYRYLTDDKVLNYYRDKKLLTKEDVKGLTYDEANNLLLTLPETQFLLIPISDYNRVMGENLSVNRGEALILRLSSEPKNETYDLITIRGEYAEDENITDNLIHIEYYYEVNYDLEDGGTSTIKSRIDIVRKAEYLKCVGTVDNFVVTNGRHIDELANSDLYDNNTVRVRYAFINDEDFEEQCKRFLEDRKIFIQNDKLSLPETADKYKSDNTDIAPAINHYFGADLNCSDKIMYKIDEIMSEKFMQLSDDTQREEIYNISQKRYHTATSGGIYETRPEFYAIYGGLFFLGVLFCIVFVLSTVMIMYYKQVTEGYEDKAKFEILQKVGMTKSEIRSTVNSQVLTLFFAPLVAAEVHIVFAFPLILRLLTLFGPMDTGFLILVAIGCFVVYGAFYILFYYLTSKSYCNIVS